MTLVCGVDVGGTTFKVGVLDDTGELTDPRQIPTPAPRSPDGHEVLAAITAAIEDVRADHAIGAVGVVVPGIVDEDTGTAVWSENLGWRDVPFRTQVEAAIGLPVAFGHDVRAGAIAEARLGAARGGRDSVFLP
ncbi:MAG: ROK family protein, partial [Actinomycetes bacterium]